MNYMIIFIGGGLGSVLRFIISSIVGRYTAPSDFPWGTLAVNLLGAAMIGAMIELLALKFSASEQLRYLLVTGFLGGFTTFSAFALENSLMIMKGDYTGLAIYISVSVVGTIALALGAMQLIRFLIG